MRNDLETTSARPPLVDTYAQLPLTLVSGAGARVRDAAGRTYWDFYGGHAVALLGHAHPAVTDAVANQAGRLTFYSNVVPLDVRSSAAERLTAFAPAGLDHVFFCNSGAEANENALKLAVRHTGRKTLAALHGGFHGRTLLALAVTAAESLRKPYDGLLALARRLRPNVVADLDRVDEQVAAVIVEPILSTAGVIVLEADYLRALRSRCDDVGALLIYDEVQTGLGRLGRPFAAGEHGVLPDLVTLAKGLANGIPMGAVLMTPVLAAGIGVDVLGSTFGGGPVACAALLAVLATLEQEDLVANAARLGAYMRAHLAVGPVQAVRGRGCLLGLQLANAARPLQRALLEQGFITGTSSDPQVLRLLPPLNMPRDAVDALAAALQHVGGQVHAPLA